MEISIFTALAGGTLISQLRQHLRTFSEHHQALAGGVRE